MKGRGVLIPLSALLSMLALAPAALGQTCNSSMVDTMPNSRYQASSDGTAIDLQTGLMWMRCALGQTWNSTNSKCSGTAKAYDWKGSLQAAQTLDQSGGFAGYTDWRLPNLRELMSIDRYYCTNPTINLDAFPETPSDAFWSSSPLEGSTGEIWTLDFNAGHAVYEPTSSTYAVRLVRAGSFQP